MIKKFDKSLSVSALLISGVLLGGGSCSGKKKTAPPANESNLGTKAPTPSPVPGVSGPPKPARILVNLSKEKQEFIYKAFSQICRASLLLREVGRGNPVEISNLDLEKVSTNEKNISNLYNFFKQIRDNGHLYDLQASTLGVIVNAGQVVNESSLKRLPKKIALGKAVRRITDAFNECNEIGRDLIDAVNAGVDGNRVFELVEEGKEKLKRFKEDSLGQEGSDREPIFHKSPYKSQEAFYKFDDSLDKTNFGISHSYEFLELLSKANLQNDPMRVNAWSNGGVNGLLTYHIPFEDGGEQAPNKNLFEEIIGESAVSKDKIGLKTTTVAQFGKISKAKTRLPQIPKFPGVYIGDRNTSSIGNNEKANLVNIDLSSHPAQGSLTDRAFDWFFDGNQQMGMSSNVAGTDLWTNPSFGELNDKWGGWFISKVADNQLKNSRLFLTLFSDCENESDFDYLFFKFKYEGNNAAGNFEASRFAVEKKKLTELLRWSSSLNDENKQKILNAVDTRLKEREILRKVFVVYDEDKIEPITNAINNIKNQHNVEYINGETVTDLFVELKKHTTKDADPFARYVAISLIKKIQEHVVVDYPAGDPTDSPAIPDNQQEGFALQLDNDVLSCKNGASRVVQRGDGQLGVGSDGLKAEVAQKWLREALREVESGCLYTKKANATFSGGNKVFTMLSGLSDCLKSYCKAERLTYGEIPNIQGVGGVKPFERFKSDQVFEALKRRAKEIEDILSVPDSLKAVASKSPSEKIDYKNQFALDVNGKQIELLRETLLNKN